MKTTARMKTPRHSLGAALVGLALSAAGCSGNGAGEPADARPDARSAVPQLEPDTLPIEGWIHGMDMDPAGETLTYCTTRYQVGFVDVDGWEEVARIDLHEHYEGDEEFERARCKVRTIGDRAYALFMTSDVGVSLPFFARLDPESRTVEGFWRLPDDVMTDVGYGEFRGLAPADEPGRAYLAVPRINELPGDGSIWSVDLATGELEEHVLFETGDWDAIRFYDVVEGHMAFGSGRDPELNGRSFVMDLDTGEVLYRPAYASLNGVAVNEERRILALLNLPSAGMEFVDLDDGSPIRHMEYENAGFQPLLRWLPEGRIALGNAGSQSSYLTIRDEDSGEPLATAAYASDSLDAMVLGKDGETVYTSHYGFISRVRVPAELP